MHTIKDENLRAIRGRLLARDAELRERIRRVHADLRRELTTLPQDAADAAVVLENDEVLQAVEDSARSELQHIGRALERLEMGTYGVCEACNDSIEAARLRVVPQAARCKRCAPDG